VIGDVVVGMAVGLCAGVAFFGGLRLTLSRLPAVEHPVILTMASFFVRSAVVVGLLVAVADGRAGRVLAGLVGILAARAALVWLARRGLNVSEESSWT